MNSGIFHVRENWNAQKSSSLQGYVFGTFNPENDIHDCFISWFILLPHIILYAPKWKQGFTSDYKKVDSNVWVMVSMVEELRMNSKTMRTGWNSGSHRIYVWKYSFGILSWFEMDVRTLKLDLGIFTCKWEFKLFGNWGRSSKKTERIETWATLLGRVKLTKRIPA